MDDAGPFEEHYTRGALMAAALAEARRRGRIGPDSAKLAGVAQRERDRDRGLQRQHYASFHYQGHTSHAVAGYLVVAAISVLGGVLVALFNGGL